MWLIGAYLLIASAAFLLSVYAAYSDSRSFIIPNWISLIIAFLYFPVVFMAPHEINWIYGLITGVIVFAIGFALFALRILGGGDVKILAALSLWAGTEYILHFLFAVAVSGGLLVVVLLAKEIARKTKEDGLFLTNIKSSLRAGLKVPYGVAIALGSLPVFYHYAIAVFPLS
ncbi:MAG: prepilin peptidase [Sneathiellales bacterium]|nr:prepilin peptidase [Sneathiellales bacterium]